MRLLFAEGFRLPTASVGGLLSHAGYAVDVVGTSRDAEEAAQLASYNLTIVDQQLPDGDGLDLLRTLRKNGSKVPILLLNALHSTETLIKCLDAGADDCLARPFDNGEFLARIRALLRRSRDDLYLTLKAGNLSFDTGSRELRIDGRPLTLSRRETSLVEVLLRRSGRIVTRETIETMLFESHREFTPNAIEASVSRLRKRLADGGSSSDIRTVRGLGYLIGERTGPCHRKMPAHELNA
ncbi:MULTISPECIES: response regulator transcription factor [unclassified Bradyrhizobium]|uniref:response regulator transcription factor n=1 Tax=unclassified Bradyrhizobium TaxID=2631580 RepID=UPI001FF2F922|nr:MULTISPECIES: response regulator transcription factor [unclassified Bradyrhizobium]MCJ9700072.1 response regulator transcription factor [Bradyrhizobium sp. SHOUNA76]MCJ9729078.1 response regulator transcription factor [Bradyrhizobium sp. PRIMUS42]